MQLHRTRPLFWMSWLGLYLALVIVGLGSIVGEVLVGKSAAIVTTITAPPAATIKLNYN